MSGQKDAANFLHKRWGDGSARDFGDRMRAVWDAQAAAPGKQMRYRAYFDSTLAGFGEVLMAIGTLPIRDVRFRYDVAGGRYGIAFTTDFNTWAIARSALSSCPVRGLRTYQDEVQGGGSDGQAGR